MVNWSKPLQLRKGWKVELLKEHLITKAGSKVAICVTAPDGNEYITVRDRDGRDPVNDSDQYDVINAPELLYGLYIEEGPDKVLSTSVFSSREEAGKSAMISNQIRKKAGVSGLWQVKRLVDM